MMKPTLAAAFAAMIAITGCQSGGSKSAERSASESVGAVNPYLWRASLDTMAATARAERRPTGRLDHL